MKCRVSKSEDGAVANLDAIIDTCDLKNPVEKFLAETAHSYANVGRMLMHVSTPEFTRYSVKLYGRPDANYKTQDFTAVDSARFLFDITEKLLGHALIEDTRPDIPAEDFAVWLRKKTERFFTHDKVDVVVDPELSAKAIAGATRIRVENGAGYI